MNVYYVRAEERCTFAGSVYGPAPPEYATPRAIVVAETPGRAKYFFMRTDPDMEMDEFIYIKCICLEKDVPYEYGSLITDAEWNSMPLEWLLDEGDDFDWKFIIDSGADFRIAIRAAAESQYWNQIFGIEHATKTT